MRADRNFEMEHWIFLRFRNNWDVCLCVWTFFMCSKKFHFKYLRRGSQHQDAQRVPQPAHKARLQCLIRMANQGIWRQIRFWSEISVENSREYSLLTGPNLLWVLMSVVRLGLWQHTPTTQRRPRGTVPRPPLCSMRYFPLCWSKQRKEESFSS